MNLNKILLNTAMLCFLCIPAIGYSQNANKNEKNNNATVYRDMAEMYGILGDREMNNENYEEAEWYYKNGAALGDIYQQKKLGEMYLFGVLSDIPNNIEQSIKYYGMAADQGDTVAMYEIGYIYEYVMEKRDHFKKAAEIYKKVASLGYLKGEIGIGRLYEEGKGVKQSYDEAFKHYKKAADQGYGEALDAIGDLYANGHIPGGYAKAMEYYLAAYKTGQFWSKKNYAPFYNWGKESFLTHYIFIGKTTSEKGKLEKLPESVAVEAIKILADEREYPNGPYFGNIPFDAYPSEILADIYLNGNGVKENKNLGLKWKKQYEEIQLHQ